MKLLSGDVSARDPPAPDFYAVRTLGDPLPLTRQPEPDSAFLQAAENDTQRHGHLAPRIDQVAHGGAAKITKT